MRVLLRRHVPGLFEQRHVDERSGVALRTGVAVPVPVAAEVSGLVDDADIVDTRLFQPRARDEACEPAADEREGDVVALGLPLDDRRVGVVEIVRELAREPDVLVVAVGAQPLGALLGVLLLQRLLIDLRRSRGVDGWHGDRHTWRLRSCERAGSARSLDRGVKFGTRPPSVMSPAAASSKIRPWPTPGCQRRSRRDSSCDCSVRPRRRADSAAGSPGDGGARELGE